MVDTTDAESPKYSIELVEVNAGKLVGVILN